jgi:hypothetical protein
VAWTGAGIRPKRLLVSSGVQRVGIQPGGSW